MFFRTPSHSNIKIAFVQASEFWLLGAICDATICDANFCTVSISQKPLVFLKSAYISCYLKLFLARQFSSIVFIWNHTTLIPLTRTVVIFIPVFFKVRLGGTLGNYQPVELCCVQFSLSYWVWHVDQYSETGSKISCHLRPSLETTLQLPLWRASNWF